MNELFFNKNKQSKNYNKKMNALILSAGLGIRMIPINSLVPKGLIIVNGKPLIDRLIEQLHEKEVYDISIVVGYMKEKFEYLIDKYNVKLICNPHYIEKNNLYSLSLVMNKIGNTYIVPCDLFFKNNPFDLKESNSWYMVSDEYSKSSYLMVGDKGNLDKVQSNGNRMIGLAYIDNGFANEFKAKLNECLNDTNFDNSYWEEVLFKDSINIVGKLISKNDVFEINTYEDLRHIDNESDSLNNEAIELISSIFNTTIDKIKEIRYLKKGMTNRSFLFKYENKNYIMRIPGEGTDKLINRQEEYNVYQEIKKSYISDEIIYMNPSNGYKISEYINDTRVCNPINNDDLRKVMKLLKRFHESNYKVNHYFDIFDRIEFYEQLRNGNASLFVDYSTTKDNIFKLKKIVDCLPKHITLTHLDSVPDNFLIYEQDNKEYIKLIDWEYASMQDSDVDLAMFCIYAMYNKSQCDNLINIYYDNKCDVLIRLKIYCYIAICGLLWSNWCEYKHSLGVEFGEYSIAQYRFAKDFYKYALLYMEDQSICI